MRVNSSSKAIYRSTKVYNKKRENIYLKVIQKYNLVESITILDINSNTNSWLIS